ncbi:hypothetical protein ACLBV5_09630 [Brevundimonas sp. M1A4_2e]
MTDTPNPSSKEVKQIHGAEIRDALMNLKTVLASRPETWFGGLPMVLDEIDRHATHRIAEINRLFELATDPED